MFPVQQGGLQSREIAIMYGCILLLYKISMPQYSNIISNLLQSYVNIQLLSSNRFIIGMNVTFVDYIYGPFSVKTVLNDIT